MLVFLPRIEATQSESVKLHQTTDRTTVEGCFATTEALVDNAAERPSLEHQSYKLSSAQKTP